VRTVALPAGLAATIALAALSVSLALVVRYALVEPAAQAAACDPAPWQAGCAIRSLVIQAFLQQRIGWVALAAAIVATLLRRRWIAGFALAAACAGIVLYSVDSSAPAALLAALVLVRPRQPPRLPAGRETR
jgi:hypothetical protein